MFGYIQQFVEQVVGYGLMIDPANGQRFFKETGNRKERADAIIQLGHPALIIADKTNTLKMVYEGQMNGAPLAARSPHHGGVAINKDAQVIGFNLKPIAGLYGARVHGAVRLGSVAMTDYIVFGRIAGKNVVKAS
ncbi:MAG: hypothetical protein ACR5LC_05440 [Symbiopectobacterium sp.]|uniref:hypothetical protein n=1 Tax=Symbiopectobacterium sp. TaxID=2952789 RepID=UPI003F40871D